jgi:hypothetical protein
MLCLSHILEIRKKLSNEQRKLKLKETKQKTIQPSGFSVMGSIKLLIEPFV